MKSSVAESKSTKTAKKSAVSEKKENIIKKTNVKKVSAKKEKKVLSQVVEPTPVAVTAKDSPAMTSKNSLIVAIALLVLAVVGYVGYRFYPIAIVNGQIISRISYYKNMETQIGKQVVENMVTEALIQQAADKAGFTVGQDQVDEQLKQIEAQVSKQGQTLDAALAAEGLTKNELVRQIKLQKVVETLGQGQVNVTNDQIAAYIEKNKNSMPTNSTKEQLQTLAKTELENETKSKNVSSWLESLKTNASIIYR